LIDVSLIGLLRRRREKAAAELPAEGAPTFEPVARSAFRTLGLAAVASQREVGDAASSVRLALRVGVRKSFDSDLAWLGRASREESDVRDAVGRLSEPVQRAFERLFWFDVPPTARHVSNVEELERAAASVRTSENGEPGEEHSALHDAALLALAGLMRLDPELRETDAWTRALDLWRRVFESGEFWSRLVAADLRGDFEQLVTYAEVRELRERAPRVVSRPLAERARDAALRADMRECGRALALLRSAGLPRGLLEEYERESLGPLEDSMVERVDVAVAWLPSMTQPGRDPATIRNYANAAWRRFGGVSPKLAEFAEAAGASHYAARRVFEHAASKLLLLSDCFDLAARREESLFVALKSYALSPPGGEAHASASAKLRALGAVEEVRAKTEDEYADALARELSDTREPEKLFKDDPTGEKALDFFFQLRTNESGLNYSAAQQKKSEFWPALLACVGFALTCFALQFFGVINTRTTNTYPGGLPLPAYTPFQLNLNYNVNLNLNLQPYVVPPPLILDEPRKAKSTRVRKRRANRADSQLRVQNGNALLLPPPAP
jgi:hypothetical protein